MVKKVTEVVGFGDCISYKFSDLFDPLDCCNITTLSVSPSNP